MNHHTDKPHVSAHPFWLVLLTIIVIISIFSCMTPQKAVDYLKKKDLLDDSCSANFPVKDSVTTVTIDSVVFDTLYLDGQIVIDSIYLEKGDDYETPYQITKVITKTITKTVEKKVRDMAFEAVLQDVVTHKEQQLGAAETKGAALEEEVTVLSGKIKKKNQKIFWLYVIIALLTAWNFRKLIARLINPIRTIIPI